MADIARNEASAKRSDDRIVSFFDNQDIIGEGKCDRRILSN